MQGVGKGLVMGAISAPNKAMSLTRSHAPQTVVRLGPQLCFHQASSGPAVVSEAMHAPT